MHPGEERVMSDDTQIPEPEDAAPEAAPSTSTDQTTGPSSSAGAPESGTSEPVKPVKPAKPDQPDTGFDSLGLNKQLVAAVAALGYEEATAIQREAIPIILSGRDLLGLAATGTGKTAAFALPLIQRIERRKSPGPFALVLVPTRELAMQVAEAVHRYGKAMDIRVLPVYGGAAMGVQLRALRRGVDVVVATPGRALDHIRRGTMRFDDLQIVILDEADEMLDMGFQEDLEEILSSAPSERQMALFSATFPRRLRDIVDKYLRNAARVEVARERAEPGEAPRVRQMAYIVRRHDKREALARILDVESPTAALMFCRTRIEVDGLTESLQSRGYRAEGLHGGMTQQHRDRVMQKMRNRAADLVVATDVAARGIDIGHLTHVINYDAPSAPEQYVHRIGRTGRAGREGTAITLLEPRERRLVRSIERLTSQTLERCMVPSLEDLHAVRLDRIREQVRDAASDGGLGPYRAICDTLVDEFDILEIAAASLKALHAQSWAEEPREIAQLPFDQQAQRPNRYERHDHKQHDRGGYQGHQQQRGPAPAHQRPAQDGEWTRLFIGLGRRARLRPGDLFGAIVNETGLARESVGNIEVAFNVSFVEVRPDAADTVIQALRNTMLRGRKVTVRRDRTPR
jgi:ATP-dependent RNA helicase DeaD